MSDLCRPLGVKILDKTYQYWMLCHNCDRWHLPQPCYQDLVKCSRCPHFGHLPLFCPIDPLPRTKPLGDPKPNAGDSQNKKDDDNATPSERIASPPPRMLVEDISKIHPDLLRKISTQAVLDYCAATRQQNSQDVVRQLTQSSSSTNLPPMPTLEEGISGKSKHNTVNDGTRAPSRATNQYHAREGTSDMLFDAQYATASPLYRPNAIYPSRGQVLQVAEALRFPVNTTGAEAERVPETFHDEAGGKMSTPEVMTMRGDNSALPVPVTVPSTKSKGNKEPRQPKQRAGSTRCEPCKKTHKKCTHGGEGNGTTAVADIEPQLSASSRKRRKTADPVASDRVEPLNAATASLTPFVRPALPHHMQQTTNFHRHGVPTFDRPHDHQNRNRTTSGTLIYAASYQTVGQDRSQGSNASYEINDHDEAQWHRHAGMHALPPPVSGSGGSSLADWRPLYLENGAHGHMQDGYGYQDARPTLDALDAGDYAHNFVAQPDNDRINAEPMQSNSMDPAYHAPQNLHDQQVLSQSGEGHQNSEAYTFDSDNRVSGTQEHSIAAINSSNDESNYSHNHTHQESGDAAPRTLPTLVDQAHDTIKDNGPKKEAKRTGHEASKIANAS
ncbi:hypothetical protein TI39_contig671g00010 [Zymoseptoria brevis]|uniref:Uncharacterized protein n=1 Tax=Zymoseptoria brevis TaxID=1047168 RepID=A0A0F4GFW9_9PEZI|nr:hypothetical protein TI39_contig671g00010 [Zymoseptoria brevis]